MPSGILESESGMPNLNKYQSADEKINAIQSYLFMLIEQMRYALGNLDTSNFNEADLNAFVNHITAPIGIKISGSGSETQVAITSDGLFSQVKDLNGKYSSLKQTVDGFDFEGMVTFDDLEEEGSTIINGSNITTGTLQADYIKLDGALSVKREYDYGGLLGYVSGSDTNSNTTDGIGLISAKNGQGFGGQIFATDSGAKICYARLPTQYQGGLINSSVTCTSTGVYVRGETFQYGGEIVSTSDRDKKKDISYDTEAYDALFDKLKPASFKFKSGTSGRTHTGLIAQDVRQAIQDAGISTQDFAAYVEYQDASGDDECGLRYGEFIGLLIDQVQRLKKRVDELEQKGGGTDAT